MATTARLVFLLVLVSFSVVSVDARRRRRKGPPCDDCTVVYHKGLDDSQCYRIPTIIQTHKGTLLAFAENRKKDCSDNGNHDLVVRRSKDGGKSWGDMITVRKGAVPCKDCPASISNPNPVEVTDAHGGKSVLLHYDTMNNPAGDKHGLDMQIWSHDDGETWTNATKLSYPPQVNKGALIGPSVGIQNAKGEIYFSAHGGFLYWSKDFGNTWQSSKRTMQMNECSIAFLVSPADGRILMNCRAGSKRSQILWSADGVPGELTYPPGLKDPNCQGSIVNAEGDIYLSNNDASDRSHLTIKRSSDGGKTWSKGTLVTSGTSGYSQLVYLGKGKMGILAEMGDKHATISFKVLDIVKATNTTLL